MSDITNSNAEATEPGRLPVLSDTAARRIKDQRAAQGDAALMLRVRVDAGGCSGFQYHYEWTTQTGPDDIVIEGEGAAAITDSISLPFLQDAVIDFKDEMIGAHFEIRNPNATMGCGCGTSFSIDLEKMAGAGQDNLS